LLIIVAVFAGRFAAASRVVFAVTKGDGGGRFWLPKFTPQCTSIVNVFANQRKFSLLSSLFSLLSSLLSLLSSLFSLQSSLFNLLSSSIQGALHHPTRLV
jgi:hypothetical protein